MFWLAQSPEILSDYLRQHFALFGLFFFIFFCLWAKKNTCIMSPPAMLGQECRNTAMSNWWSWIHKLLRGNVSLWIRPCGSIYLSKLHYSPRRPLKSFEKALFTRFNHPPVVILPHGRCSKHCFYHFWISWDFARRLFFFGLFCFDFPCFNMWGVGELFHNTKLTVKLQW